MPPFGPPVQLAYLVDDVRAAAAAWERDLGAGPFVVAEHIPVAGVVHRGRPSTFDHSSAYGWWGEVMIELVHQHDDAPSAITEWRERTGRRSGGLHHVASFTDDLDAALAVAGDDVATVARAGETRFAFVDAWARTGHYVELYEPSPRLLAFYADVRARHERRITPG